PLAGARRGRRRPPVAGHPAGTGRGPRRLRFHLPLRLRAGPGGVMEIGVMVGGGGLVEAVREAAEAGIGRVWVPQLIGLDALTAIAVAGREVPGVELGTAVVP